jgi:signal transduction histidine kinase
MQTLQNLVSNAIKFQKRGQINIEARYIEKNNTLIIDVIDKGTGVPAHLFDQLFV